MQSISSQQFSTIQAHTPWKHQTYLQAKIEGLAIDISVEQLKERDEQI